MMKPEEKAALSELKQRLFERFEVLELVLYGSKATGRDAPDSDIDVMIKLEEYTPEVESAIDDIIFEVNLAHGCLISAVLFGREELETGPMSESPLYKQIVAEGVPA